MNPTIDVPHYQPQKKEPVPIHQDPVARSIAKPDAFAKPGTFGNSKVRVRLSANPNNVKIRRKKKNWDRRDVTFY